ncbi:MAG: hypothetical protein WCM76_05785 [Bacteroidota bacterium]
MPTRIKKKKVKKIKYKKVAFKLSEKQKSVIDRFCKVNNTSPNKMIKSAIREYLGKYADTMPQDDYISENQLQLFDFEDDPEEDNTLEMKFE